MTRCLKCLTPFTPHFGWTALIGIGYKKPLICPECESTLHKIKHISCPMCGRDEAVLPHHRSLKNTWGKNDDTRNTEECCADCKHWLSETGPVPMMNRSLYTYNEGMKELMATFKYRGDAAIATLFTKELAKFAKQSGADLYTVIPLAGDRHWERGFNQARLLAADLPITPLLMRTGTTEGKQSKRSRDERMAHLTDAFQLSPNHPDLTNQTVCIIDDIYTTGATIKTTGTLLQNAGAERVISTTLIRA